MHHNLNDINAALQMAATAPALPREVEVHPFERAKLGRAPFACVDCTIATGEAGDTCTRCQFCTTHIKYVYHIKDADGRKFVVGSECVKQTGGAVAGFEKFNRQMEARVRELRRTAAKERAAAKVAASAHGWKEANAAEYVYMQQRAERGNTFYKYLLECVAKYGSIFESRLVGVRADMARDAKPAEPVAAPRRPEPPVVNLDAVESAFGKAGAAGIRNPKLRLGGFVFSPAKANSTNPGAIYIKTRVPAGELPGVYMGKVLGGKFLKVRDCDAAQEAEILAVCADPKAAAVAYGKQIGKCSVCNRDLTDAASVEAGIGPVCAARYGF